MGKALTDYQRGYIFYLCKIGTRSDIVAELVGCSVWSVHNLWPQMRRKVEAEKGTPVSYESPSRHRQKRVKV